LERKAGALDKIDKREHAALERDENRDERVLARGGDDWMPSLELVAGVGRTNDRDNAPDLLRAFERARNSAAKGAPDLTAAFERAAGTAVWCRKRGRVRQRAGSRATNRIR
jgi:hypothetical protein